jgi:hypothetical protein
MSSVLAALRRTGGVVRPAVRGWRAIVLPVVAALAVAGLLVAHFHPAGLFGGTSGAQASTGGPASVGAGGNGPNGTGQSENGGSAGSTSSPGSQTSQGGSSDTKSGSTPKPSGSPIAKPTPSDGISGGANVLHSDCADGYEPGAQCTVYYQGNYQLASQPTGKVVFEVVIDGTVADSQLYVAPGGPHRFGGNLKFTVPPHAKKIVYDCMLEDATGKVLVKSQPQVTFGYG